MSLKTSLKHEILDTTCEKGVKKHNFANIYLLYPSNETRQAISYQQPSIFVQPVA